MNLHDLLADPRMQVVLRLIATAVIVHAFKVKADESTVAFVAELLGAVLALVADHYGQQVNVSRKVEAAGQTEQDKQ